MVESLDPPYVLRSVSAQNRGRAAACNTGVALAEGWLLVILDDDMEPSPELIEGHLRAHPPGSRRGVVGAVPIPVGPESPPVVDYIGTKFNRHLETLAQPGYRFTLRDFYTGNFSIRRDLLVEIGGFDEAFKIYGNEDLELFLRLAGAGVEIAFSPNARAQQHYAKDFTALARDNIAKGRTAVLLAAKHPEAFRDLRLSQYGDNSWKWRFARTVLLGLTELWSKTPDRFAAFMHWLGWRRPRRLHTYYAFAMDYFYWVGARAAQREGVRLAPGS